MKTQIKLLLAGVAAVAITVAQVPVSQFTIDQGQAFAQGQGGGNAGSGRGGSGGGHSSGGSSGGHSDGGSSGGHSDGGALGGPSGGAGGHAGSGSDRGQGGPSADSEGRGGPQSRPSAGTRGGKPVWAQEGIPEVELGRLNVVRAPAKVLDRQLAEVLSTWNPATALPGGITLAQLYSMSAADFAAYISKYFSDPSFTMIDSPLANLALLKDLLLDGKTQLTGVSPASIDQLAAILIGSASDKTVPITTDTVIAVTKILGVTVSDPAAVAAMAEAVRVAISVAHG